MSFIDTHNHVIPYVDDGADDWQTALKMLRMGQEDGIRELVCTPHVLSDKDLREEHKYIEKFNELRERAADAGISIKMHLGSELYVQPGYDFKRHITTLAQNGRYFLIEFPMSSIPPIIANQLFDLFSDAHVPIIAHPERNGGLINNPYKALEFVKKGALLQLTAGSLLGVFGTQIRMIAKLFMDANLVHIIATDAHDTSRRPLTLRRSYDYVKELWGIERAHALFIDNPRKLIRGESIEIGSPLPLPDIKSQPKTLTERVKLFFNR